MLEHGRPTNRGDLLTDGAEIMMATTYFERPKKKSNYGLGDSLSNSTPKTGGGNRAIIFGSCVFQR